jgi:dimethylamine/trimethylamine dehydrogenase
VGVGRFTSPDLMVRQVTSGILDLVGAARPSIADPFLPEKIRTNQLHLIRECIGCNMCVSGDFTMSPIRCTQNPAMGEEYRRGWHPERLRRRGSEGRVLVVGAGPAGMEAARALGVRGYEVVLAEASRELGGRVRKESRLPGLAAWVRVKDYREQAIAHLPTVEVYRESPMTVEDALEYGFDHVAVATGATWRRDGVARWHTAPIDVHPGMEILTPDDLMAGRRPVGRRVVLFDDDHYYLGGVLAELLASEGFEVHLVTPAAQVSAWTANTLELVKVQRRVLEAGVRVHTARAVTAVGPDHVLTACAYTGSTQALPAEALVLVTARLPQGEQLLDGYSAAVEAGHLTSVRAIGDAHAPGTIAMAVWSGRRFAEELDAELPPNDAVPFRREVTGLSEHV